MQLIHCLQIVTAVFNKVYHGLTYLDPYTRIKPELISNFNQQFWMQSPKMNLYQLIGSKQLLKNCRTEQCNLLEIESSDTRFCPALVIVLHATPARL